jgi:hypothetical protein
LETDSRGSLTKRARKFEKLFPFAGIIRSRFNGLRSKHALSLLGTTAPPNIKAPRLSRDIIPHAAGKVKENFKSKREAIGLPPER